MISRLAMMGAALALAACAAEVPDSNPYAGDGVGFSRYGDYAAQRARRDAELQAQRSAPVPEEQAIAAETLGVLNATAPLGGTTVASASQPAAVSATPEPAADPGAPLVAAAIARNNPGISDEQNFDAVSSRETIESDRERLARQRDAFQIAQPEALPDRPGSTGPNIVSFALSTTNQVGEQIYDRPDRYNESSYLRACARYGSPDHAQAAFLDAGGPRRDRRGVDPDGDGFACFWDPTPFRTARQ